MNSGICLISSYTLQSCAIQSQLDLTMRDSMRILVAEDDAVSLAILHYTLEKWGYDVECVNDGIAALDSLQREDAPRLAILDWMMPGMNGIEICKTLRQMQNYDHGYTYLIMLTIRSSHLDMLDGLSAGADDYIIKPFMPQDLKVRLDAGLRIVELQEKLVETRKALESQPRDITTRIWKRETILSHLHAELNRAKRKGRSLSIAMLKINNYRELRNALNKVEMEEFLYSSLQQIRDTIRSYDSIGHYHDDEFLIVFPETVSEEMPGITDRLLNVINRFEGSDVSGKSSLSVTLGVVTCLGYTEEETLISTAVEMLRQASLEGLNRALFSFVT